MSTKLFFTGSLKVILWLSFPCILLAQVLPERTKPTTVGCWDCQVSAAVEEIKSVPKAPVIVSLPKPTPAASEETPDEEEIRELRKQVADLQRLGARDKMISLRAAQIDLENKIKKEQKRMQKIKDEDSSARKARKEMEKRENAERKTRERFALAWSNAKPKCRGSQDPAGIRILSTGHFNYNPFQAFNVVLVTNWQPFPVIITAVDPNKGGEVVELPYGCSVTLGRSIIPGRENVNNGGVTFYYTATASDLKNHQREFRSQSFYLRSGNSSIQQDSSRWNIGQQPVEYSSSY